MLGIFRAAPDGGRLVPIDKKNSGRELAISAIRDRAASRSSARRGPPGVMRSGAAKRSSGGTSGAGAELHSS